MRVGRGWGGLAPGLRASPGAGCGEIDVDGNSGGLYGLGRALSGRGGLQELSKAVAELRDGVAKGEEAIEQHGTCEVEGVTGDIEASIENRRLLTSQGQ